MVLSFFLLSNLLLNGCKFMNHICRYILEFQTLHLHIQTIVYTFWEFSFNSWAENNFVELK